MPFFCHELQKTNYYCSFLNHATSCWHCKRYRYTHFSSVRNDRNQFCFVYTLYPLFIDPSISSTQKNHQYLIYCKNADIKFNCLCAICTQIDTNRIKFESKTWKSRAAGNRFFCLTKITFRNWMSCQCVRTLCRKFDDIHTWKLFTSSNSATKSLIE